MLSQQQKKDAFDRLYHTKIGHLRSEPKSIRDTVTFPSDPFQESVYNLIPKVAAEIQKEQRYRSNFSAQARVEYKKDVKKAASMGPLKVSLPPATQFLKKGQGVGRPSGKEKLTLVPPASKKVKAVLKAPVPSSKDKPIVPQSSKDFVKQNALDTINALPKNLGNKEVSPLERKDYGKIPEYLQKRIVAMKQQELEHATMMSTLQKKAEANSLKEQGIVVLPDDERSRILKGLQDNWEKLNKDYQKLSLTVDTLPKITRKVTLEQQLKQYEELIDKFSNSNIHISFDPAHEAE